MPASEEWVSYTVQRGDTIRSVLVRYGFVSAAGDEALEQRIWMAPANTALRQPDRQPREIRAADLLWLPPRESPNDAAFRRIHLSPNRGTLAEIVAEIKQRHGAGSLEPLGISLDRLTPEYLYNLFENIPLTRIYPNGPASVAWLGDSRVYVNFPVQLRRAAHRSVAPSGSVKGKTLNYVMSSGGEFDVKVGLKMPDGELALLSNEQARFRSAKARFAITIKKITGLNAVRTTIRVLQFDESVYFEKAYTAGELIAEGTHDWEWDGFTSDAADAELDTRILRGRLCVQVVVESTRGQAGTGYLNLANTAEELTCADFWVSLDPARPTIEIYAYMNFIRLHEAWILFVLIPLLTPLLLLALEYGLLGMWDVTAGKLWPDDVSISKETWDKVHKYSFIVAAGLAAALFIALLIYAAASSLSDAQMAVVKALMKEGMRRHWSRTGNRAVTVDGVKFQVFGQGVERSSNSVDYVLMKSMWPFKRGCNLGTLVPGLPTIIPVTFDDQGRVGGESGSGMWERDSLIYTGAHEFGHSTLRADKGFMHSMTHKGTSTVLQGISESAAVDDGGELDLMKYPAFVNRDYHARSFATEEDVLGVLRTAHVLWRVIPSPL